MKDVLHQTSPGGATKAILDRHLSAFMDNDLPTLMADYTEESLLITQEATYSGLKEIKDFFVGLMSYFPSEQSTFILDKMEIRDELAFIVWHGRTPSLAVPLGSDTFAMKEGKIHGRPLSGN
jgi:hypothetical protein